MTRKAYSAPHFTRSAPHYSASAPTSRLGRVHFSTRPKYGTRHYMPKVGVLNLSPTVRSRRSPI